MKNKKNENPNEWKILGIDETKEKRRLRRQVNTFLFVLVVVIIVLLCNIFTIKKYDMNIFKFGYLKYLENKVSEEIVDNDISNVVLNTVNNTIDNNVVDYEITKKEPTKIENVYTFSSNNIITFSKITTQDKTDAHLGQQAPKIELLEIDNTGDNSKLNFVLDYYTTDPSFKYYITVKLNNEILVNSNEILDYPTELNLNRKIDLTNENTEIEIDAIEKLIATNEETYRGTLSFNLKDSIIQKYDLEEIQDRTLVNFGDMSYTKLNTDNLTNDLKVLVYSNDIENNVNENNDDTLISNTYSVYKQYGNYEIIQNTFNIVRNKNIKNLSIEDYIKDLEILSNIEDIMTLDIKDNYEISLVDKNNQENIVDVNFSFEQMLDFCSGKDVSVNDIIYNINNYENNLNMYKYSTNNTITANGTNGVGFVIYDTTGNEIYNIIVFKVGDYFYKIEIPLSNNTKNIAETERFINSIKFN